MSHTNSFAAGSGVNRRDFLKTVAAAGAGVMLGGEALAADGAVDIERKIRLGVIGNGGRGGWIAGLFKKHGGYAMHAVCDYFPEVAEKCGEGLGVEKGRRFSGLSGYKKLIESGVEAVAVETPPYFIPEHAKAAVEAGLHVYMAKPVAVDVPGCLTIEAAGKEATGKGRVFLVDYQMPTEPVNIEIVQRIRDGAIGKIAYLNTIGMCSGFGDPPKTKTIESRLRQLIWVNDVAMGCDYIGNFDIHAIDAALWVAGQRPVAASGASSIRRENPHGDSRDVCQVIYEYGDGLIHNHSGQGLKNLVDGALMCKVAGTKANAQLNYWGKAFLRGGTRQHAGEVANLYPTGAERNIATFHRNIVEGHFENPTVRRSVDGCLTCILGREAAARRVRMTMEELIQENKRLEVDLSGLKA